MRYVSIETTAGESGESVALRLANAINDRNNSGEKPLWVGRFQAKSSEASLILPGGPGSYIFGGTESGLGIPKPPTSLSCTYNKESTQIYFNWVNAEKYDFILVRCLWTDFDYQHVDMLAGDSTNFSIDANSVNVSDLNFLVVGFKNNLPSNVAALHVNNYCQSEEYGIPFTDGIAPNWNKWCYGETTNKDICKQGEKYTRLVQPYNPSRSLLTKPFYQVINAPTNGAICGVWRKFIGLHPGHTYRITACLSTLEMDTISKDWSFKLQATHNGPSGRDLTPQQLAGLAPLPGEELGATSGKIVSYTSGTTTPKNKFALELSRDASHVTLPSDVNTITVWLSFSCLDPDGKVGFSGLKVEDISERSDVKSEQQIIQEEREEQEKVLQRERKFLSM